jgi:hypothetical protein
MFPGLFDVSKLRLTLTEFPYLFGDRQALPKKHPKSAGMVMRFPLGFP